MKDYTTASFPVLCKNGSWGDAASGRKIVKKDAEMGTVQFTSDTRDTLNQKLEQKIYGYTIDCDAPAFLLFSVWEADRINKHGLNWRKTFSVSLSVSDRFPTGSSGNLDLVHNWFSPQGILILRRFENTLTRSADAPSIHTACLNIWHCSHKGIQFPEDPLTLLEEWGSGELEKKAHRKFDKLAHIGEIPFGIEIEFTGISRDSAARTVAKVLGTEKNYAGGIYHTHIMYDSMYRCWNIKCDSSIIPSNNRGTSYNKDNYRCELISPILHYDSDMSLLCKIVSALRKRGAVVNSSCGLHVHVDTKLSALQIRNLANIIASKEALLKRAVCMSPSRSRYCHNSDEKFIESINRSRNIDMDDIKKAWYDGDLERMRWHYDQSRYVTLNLHSLWRGKGIELRCFNSTLSGYLIETYILLSLAVCNQAAHQYKALSRPSLSNDKLAMTNWLNAIGLCGHAYRKARKVLLSHLSETKSSANPAA